MIFISILFFIAIIVAFGMLTFRTWQLRTGRAIMPQERVMPVTKIPFRQIEKSMLYLTKHIIQLLVLEIAKWWFVLTTKIKRWLAKMWPKHFKKDPNVQPAKPSFVRRAVRESRVKIKKIKERVKKEHEEKDSLKEAVIASEQIEQVLPDENTI